VGRSFAFAFEPKLDHAAALPSHFRSEIGVIAGMLAVIAALCDE
jgi:hypothetical protein